MSENGQSDLLSFINFSNYLHLGNEAELIFTRSVTSSEDASKEMERLLVLEATHHQIAKADDRVPRRFSQHTKRV